MFRRDYIVRMIEDMTAMVAKVFSLKQERKTTEALWEIDELLNRHFRLNSRLLNSLSVEDVIAMFRLGGTLEADRLQGAARMLQEEALIYDDRGREDESLPRWMKTLHFYLAARENGADTGLIGLDDEIDRVLARVNGLLLPAKTERLLVPYLEERGRYAKAEDALFRLAEQGEDAAAMGRSFYGRLAAEDPDKLEQGGLPLEEVVQGSKEWERLYGQGNTGEEENGQGEEKEP
ncbi:DUF6483 family protein [Paenibacillus glufosinatiresistens]|uniref:DUF6483 family protein n=1 Tax=Paenibacillus glufosinatiresistens TaxID=3070657 RepID=UPI00286EA960|nr:DUF6483 family protein [Paenibacillus sp. YX.27]